MFMGGRLMRRLAWLCVFFSGVSLASASFSPGEKVWIAMYADNLKDDGYAIGKVHKLLPDGRLKVVIDEVVVGKGRTLHGTCHPSGGTVLSGATIVDASPASLHVEQTLTPGEVQPYLVGRSRFLERENLATVIQRWLSDGFGMSSEMLRSSAVRATALGSERAALAFTIMAHAEDAQGAGQGFPQPLRQRAAHLAEALAQTQAALAQDPAAYQAAVRLYGQGFLRQSDNLPAVVSVKLLHDVKADMQALRAEFGSFEAASQQIANLADIHLNYLRMLTQGGAQTYADQSLQSWMVASDQGWPVLP